MQTYTEATKAQRDLELRQKQFEGALHERKHLESLITQVEQQIDVQQGHIAAFENLANAARKLDPSLTSTVNRYDPKDAGDDDFRIWSMPAGLSLQPILLELCTNGRIAAQHRIDRLHRQLETPRRQLKDVLKALEQFED
ncbi:MAG TPA: hypothetical protein VJN96_12890 [Vicinamibacterales bacterium]|nr:hypothetical protein [Vicinamibacterales bacterium]